MDSHPEVPEKYVLEVSSPGVERPLSRRKDFVRFTGQEIEVSERQEGAGGRPGRSRVSGILEGVEDAGEEYAVVIRTADESRILLPRNKIAKAKLVFHWNEEN